MSEGSAQQTSESAACGMAVADVEATRDACVTKQTRGKYKSSLNDMAKWIRKSRDVEDGTLSGYWSAIKDQYRVRRLALPPKYGDGMQQLFSGMKRLEADSDQISNPKTSGKQSLTYSLFQKLCKETLELGDDQFLIKAYKLSILWLKMMALV
ncbi:hypothetical protein F442_22397 [Phytophthora nicotianae P10297]|uniref:Core-binding (CB) domain-containing protein n=1 Tax=Phytophthora nicotianae P10297 TaxID=1317064 RepID=W2Y291_PHYNI|nr:hypothetical protein F442_22397 [Phytophthora nicotianae P10297]